LTLGGPSFSRPCATKQFDGRPRPQEWFCVDNLVHCHLNFPALWEDLSVGAPEYRTVRYCLSLSLGSHAHTHRQKAHPRTLVDRAGCTDRSSRRNGDASCRRDRSRSGTIGRGSERRAIACPRGSKARRTVSIPPATPWPCSHRSSGSAASDDRHVQRSSSTAGRDRKNGFVWTI
jgi:hypothetical protein